MKASELRGLSIDDLVAKENDLAEELFKLNFQHGIRPLENTAKLGELKKHIARVKTVVGEKRKMEAAG
ncbi:MAG: 50S ribosomal protein L29 [Desulfurivibrionaceae bacterium]|nr:50S ribosomal protein L29 [Desulfobulbales bacterium]MDT8335167.1 50S ribosomal protein L29 [Desulfurivibrionaceae bacterium]